MCSIQRRVIHAVFDSRNESWRCDDAFDTIFQPSCNSSLNGSERFSDKSALTAFRGESLESRLVREPAREPVRELIC